MFSRIFFSSKTYLRNLLFIPVTLSFCILTASCSRDTQESDTTNQTDNNKDNRPNIVYIMADDLGYADLGIFGSEIPTPNLDMLASQGMLLTDFHTSLTCSPTRSMLMSGTDNHVAGLGVMGRSNREDQRDAPGYEAYLNFRVASLADLMTDAGYNTYMTGKWHLGNDVETGPRARGFKKSFVSLNGAAHLGGLSWNGPGLAPYRDGEEIINIEDDDFYTTEFYTQRMIEYIEEDREDGKPFFSWLAYTAPHWPLQAPKESIERFNGWYDEGYEALYESRFNRMKELGIIEENAEMMGDHIWETRWADLSDEEKQFSARRMEIYAAMVSDLDTYVGTFLEYLKEIGEYDNTFIVFSSDNGAESGRLDLGSMTGWIERCCDNSFDNLGAGDSYVMYGRDWATSSTVAHVRHKGTAFEGGMRVPAFAWFPGVVEPGEVSGGFSTIMDLMPTFLDLAGTEHPGTMYRGQEIQPIKGKSLMPQLSGEVETVYSDDEYIGWELYGQRSIRQGDWKIVWDNAQGLEAHWMLFNLAEDRSEQVDLGPEYPDKLTQMIELWDLYAEESGVIY